MQLMRLSEDLPGIDRKLFIDEDVLAEAGMKDFTHYAVDPTASLNLDIFRD